MTPWSSKYPSSHSVVDEVEAAIPERAGYRGSEPSGASASSPPSMMPNHPFDSSRIASEL